MDPNAFATEVAKLPESTQLVVKTLASMQPMTGKQLQLATGLPRRTLYTSLRRLDEAGWLKSKANLKDTRQAYHALAFPVPDMWQGHAEPPWAVHDASARVGVAGLAS